MAIVKRGKVYWAYFTKRVYGEDGAQLRRPDGTLIFKQDPPIRLSSDKNDALIKYGKILELRRLEKDGIATGKADYPTWKTEYFVRLKNTAAHRTYNLTARAFKVLEQYAHIKTLGQITPNFLSLFRDDYLVGQLKYSAVLANRTIRAIVTGMKDARKRRLILKHEWSEIGRRLKEPTRSKDNFTSKELRRMLLWKPDKEHNFHHMRRIWTCFVAIGSFTGARRAEISFSLKKSIDLETWMFYIEGHKKNISSGILENFELKDKEARKIPIHPRLRPYIMWLLKRNPNCPYLFSDENGKQINPDFWTTHFPKYARAAGVQNANPHRLRHTFGTLLGRSKVGPKTICDLMGHSSLATAYGYMNTGDEERAILQLKI